jgi:aspartate aminotransferase
MAGICQVVADAEGRFGSEISVVSDEVHRGVVWGGGAFVSPLRSHARGISIYSFGKALALQGQRIGYIAVSPRMPRAQDVRRRLERCLQVMGFGSPNSLMQYAVCDLLDYKPALSALAKTQACVRRTLADYGYDVCDGDATFYVYVRSPIADDFRFAELLASHGVLVVPSTLFHERGFIRLSLTARSEAIAAALPVFGRVRGER